MRAIVYGRVNRADAPLAAQVEEMEHYCEEHGIEVVDTVTDCCSGLMVGDNLRLLLSDDECREFDAIVVRDISRISRKHDLMMDIAGRMKKRNIKMITANGETIGLDRASGIRIWEKMRIC